MTYDGHDALVVKSFEEIYQSSIKRFNFDTSIVFIEHIKGKIKLGEINILIAVAYKNRDQAYELSRFFIEEIKKKTPIQKKEHYEDSCSEWLEGNPIQKYQFLIDFRKVSKSEEIQLANSLVRWEKESTKIYRSIFSIQLVQILELQKKLVKS